MDCATMVYKSDRKSGEDEFTNESKNHDVEAFIIKVTLSCTLDESYSASTKVLSYNFGHNVNMIGIVLWHSWKHLWAVLKHNYMNAGAEST